MTPGVTTHTTQDTSTPDDSDWHYNPIIRITVPIGIIFVTLVIITACFLGIRKYLKRRRQYEYELHMVRSRSEYENPNEVVHVL